MGCPSLRFNSLREQGVPPRDYRLRFFQFFLWFLVIVLQFEGFWHAAPPPNLAAAVVSAPISTAALAPAPTAPAPTTPVAVAAPTASTSAAPAVVHMGLVSAGCPSRQAAPAALSL